jgi:hypothetical protein
MHKELRPEQIDILVGSPAVNDEFSQKVRELDRRLQMNGMQYREWDTLNDRQHDIFTDNLFLDGECASSAENYVKGAVASCGCPDTEEELHHHSPVLMREIEKQEDMLPDMKVKIGESLGFLNEMIDQQVERLITEKKINKGDQYELDVLSLMIGLDPDHTLLADRDFPAGSRSDLADADFKIGDDDPYNLELKLSGFDLMGSGLAKGTLDDLQPSKSFQNDPDAWDIVKQGILSRKKEFAQVLKELSTYVDPTITDPVGKSATAKYLEHGATGFPIYTTNDAWKASGSRGGTGSRRKADNYGKGALKMSESFVQDRYAKKNTHYIQLGGLGLYYMAEDPANLASVGVKKLEIGGMVVEIRMRGYGREAYVGSARNFTKNLFKNGLITEEEKAWLDSQPWEFFRTAALNGSARFDKDKVLEAPKSDYDLGTSAGVMKLVSALCKQGRQTGRPLVDGGLSWCAKQKQLPQEDPAEPEGLEVEPEESEDS